MLTDRPESPTSASSAILLAGGRGTRLSPLTEICAKPMLPVGPRPLIVQHIQRLAAAGVSDVVLSLGYRATDFARLAEHPELRGCKVRLRVATEPQPLGTGGALRYALRTAAMAPSGLTYIVNADLLSDHCLALQAAALERHPTAMLSLHVREVADPHRYGSVLVDSAGLVTSFVEKSAAPPSNLINAGTYLVRLDAFRAALESCPAGGFSLEEAVFPELAAQQRIVAYRQEAYFLDVGTPEAFLQANLDALGHHSSWVSPRAQVASSARLSGGSSVHDSAVVEEGANVQASVVLAGAVVGRAARLRRCVVSHGARVAAGASYADTVIT